MKSVISVYLELVTLGMACHELFILYICFLHFFTLLNFQGSRMQKSVLMRHKTVLLKFVSYILHKVLRRNDKQLKLFPFGGFKLYSS